MKKINSDLKIINIDFNITISVITSGLSAIRLPSNNWQRKLRKKVWKKFQEKNIAKNTTCSVLTVFLNNQLSPSFNNQALEEKNVFKSVFSC